MAIIIEKAKIKNTDIELSNIYARLSYNAMYDGIRTSANLVFYLSKSDYELSKAPTFEHKQISVELPYNFNISLKEDENQDLIVVTNKVVEELTNLGFKATSDITSYNFSLPKDEII
jgi:hypothetical protein